MDTTATFADVMMTGTRWVQLLTLCAKSQVHVVIPDVVMRETARHWERQAEQAIQTARQRLGNVSKSKETFDHLGLDASQLPEANAVTATADRQQFQESMCERLLGLDVDLRPVPDDVTIETVLARDLDRKKPFDKSGKGFRDALIWETAKKLLLESEDGDVLYFVTHNTSDYCDVGSFAAELLEEFDEAAGTLVWVKDLDDLMSSEELAPLAADLSKSDEELALFLASAGEPDEPDYEPPTVGEVVRKAVLHAIDDLVNDDVETTNVTTSGHDFTELMIPTELESLSISSIVADESTLTWQTYETYDDTTLLIRAEVIADVELEGFAYKSDAIGLEGRLHVLDWDWNDHMANVSLSVRPNLIFQVRVERGMEFAEECELEGVDPSDLIDDTHP